MFVLKAGRSPSWPDSYRTFQHGMFLLASPEQQRCRVYPGWNRRYPRGLVPAGDAGLPARPSRSTWSYLGTLRLHYVIFSKAELSMGPQELLRRIQFTRLGFNTFSVASSILVISHLFDPLKCCQCRDLSSFFPMQLGIFHLL